MSLGHSPSIVTSGLVLALDAANIKSYPGSGTTWTDLSNNGNNATLTSSPTYNSSNNGSLVFNGSSQYADISLSSSLQFGTGDFTIEYWIYPISKTNQYPPLFANYSSSFTAGTIFIGASHDNYLNKYSFFINGSSTAAATSTNLTYNTWEHLVAVRESGTCKLYLNGIQDGTTINGSGITLNGEGSFVKIGTVLGFYYNGRISSVKVYKNKALTATEVLQNFNALRGRYGI